VGLNLGGLHLAGCASTPKAAPASTPAEGAQAEATTTPTEPGAQTAPADGAVATETPAEGADAANEKPGEKRSADGIDDDTWLPTKGPARDAFLAAVEKARTDPKGAVNGFVGAAKQTTYFYAAWFNAGVAAEAAGDNATAEAHYKTALKTRPDYGPALVNLAMLYERTGREGEAASLIDNALRAHADKAGPHVAAATRAWAKHDLPTTEREAMAAIKIDERMVPAIYLMSLVFIEQGRLETARFALEENAIPLEPGNALLHLTLGHVHLKLNDEKRALSEFEKAAKLRPDLAEAQEHYGVLLQRNGLTPEAVRAYSETVKLRPQSATAQLHLGNGLRAEKHYPEAEAAYKKALQLDPKLADAHFNLALLYIDNPLPNLDEVARLQQAVTELKAYEQGGTLEPAMRTRVAGYLESTQKRISKEQKRRERDERRKKEEAAEKAEADKAAAEKAAAEKAAAEKPAEAKADDAKGDDAKKSDDAKKGDATSDAKSDDGKPAEATPAEGEKVEKPAKGTKAAKPAKPTKPAPKKKAKSDAAKPADGGADAPQ
jgi:tetratricopeptide (TPR) repeat protein